MRNIRFVGGVWLAIAASTMAVFTSGWSASPAPAPDRKFTIAVVPDTQNYLDFKNQRSEGYPFDAVEIFYDQMEWISRNLEGAGGEIAFVTQVGDVWQHATEEIDAAHRAAGMEPDPNVKPMLPDERARTIEMPAARRGFSMLEGRVPFSVVPGNHDYDAVWQVKGSSPALIHYGGLKNFNEVFGERTAFFRNKPWRVSSFNGGADSATLFSAGGYRFLHFGFEYAPADDVLAWAESVMRKYPDVPTIVAIHDHLNKQGQRKAIPAIDLKAAHSVHNNAEDLWQKFLSRHGQVFLVLSGHQAGQSRRVDAGADGKVWQLLADYQDRNQVLRNVLGANARATGGLGDGWMRLLDFDFTGTVPRMQVRTYSTYFKAQAGELPNYAAWYKPQEQPALTDAAFLAEDEFTIELDDFVRRFGPPRPPK